MMDSDLLSSRSPLIPGLSQFDVDFVIPRIGVDLPLGIDPFLLFKSRDPELAALHDTIIEVFNLGVETVRRKDTNGALYLFDFPEVTEIGLGYTTKSKRGSGVGQLLSRLIVGTLQDSPELLERGIRHVEEMQLVSIGIAADRISDITANLIKHYLITYTQRQSRLWNIPLKSNVPISHIFDPDRLEWHDSYVDLPVDPLNQNPIVLVPRRIVRALPWINYNDYFRMEFQAYLRKKRIRGTPLKLTKEQIVAVTRSEVERIDRYVKKKETTAEDAHPGLGYLDLADMCPEAERLKSRLSLIESGIPHASRFQYTVLEVLNYLFNPELIDGETEVRTIDGTERRDIVFTNDSDENFWDFVRNEHSSVLLMFETKNVVALEPAHFNQVATYLGDRLGRLGFIVTQNQQTDSDRRKAFSVYNDSSPRKIILVLTKDDLYEMIDMKCRGHSPTRYIQKKYREFRQTVQ